MSSELCSHLPVKHTFTKSIVLFQKPESNHDLISLQTMILANARKDLGRCVGKVRSVPPERLILEKRKEEITSRYLTDVDI